MQRVQSWFRIWFHAVFRICLRLYLYQSRTMLVLMRSVWPRHPNLQWTVCLCSSENTAVSSLVLRRVWCCCSWDIRFHWELGSRVGVELVGLDLDRHISDFSSMFICSSQFCFWAALTGEWELLLKVTMNINTGALDSFCHCAFLYHQENAVWRRKHREEHAGRGSKRKRVSADFEC